MKKIEVIFILIVLCTFALFISGCGTTSNSGNITNNTGNQVKTEKYACPDLSIMNLTYYNNITHTGFVYPVNYNQKNIEVIFSSGYGPTYCNADSEEGQNANWVYCGGASQPITAQYTDAQGNIVKKRSVQVIFDKSTSQYIATRCDTYNLR